MNKPLFLTLLVMMMGALMPSVLRADLREYVQRPDDSFRYRMVRTQRVGAATAHTLELTSQTWRGIPWRHWLVVVVPDELEVRDRALLIIGGGETGEPEPDLASDELAPIAPMVIATGAPGVYIGQVPNQPLFDGLVEDALIAHTFDVYLNGGEDDWPLLLPMVRSATAAMDAAQAVLREKSQLEVKSFLLTGASKRGWTTWLTAAIDPRVIGIAPMVIDLLNLGPQMRHQVQTWGRFSDRIGDYVVRKIPQRMDTERGHKLVAMVDPFVYREQLTMPKLVVLGTNDPYWPVDSARFYYDALPPEKHLLYVPNTGHRLGLGALATTMQFIRATMRGDDLPKLKWQHDDDGALHVTWTDPNAQATLWQATSPNRDFRAATWTAQTLEGQGECSVKIEAPAEDWLAYFIEVSFRNKDGVIFPLTTGLTVLPDHMPYDERGARKDGGPEGR